MKQLTNLSLVQIRGYFRDKTAVFFTFLFPLIFLFVFGLLFGNESASKTDIGVVGDGSVVASLPTGALEVQRFQTEQDGIKAVNEGEIPGVLIQSGNELRLRYAGTDQVAAARLTAILDSTINAANLRTAGVTQPQYVLDSQPVETNQLKPIEQLTPGIVSWAVATSACFGAALTFVSWRQKQLLRRIRLAPVATWKVVASRVALALAVAFIQAAVFFGLAFAFLDFSFTSGFWLYIPVLVCGTLAFLAIGQLIGSFAKTPDSASAAANLVVLPMAFLSGVFIPADEMPKWVQDFSQLMPLKHMNEATVDVLARGKGAEALLVPCAILLAFTLVVSLASAKAFRWEK